MLLVRYSVLEDPSDLTSSFFLLFVNRYPVHISPNLATCYEAENSLRRKKTLTETAVPRSAVFF